VCATEENGALEVTCIGVGSSDSGEVEAGLSKVESSRL